MSRSFSHLALATALFLEPSPVQSSERSSLPSAQSASELQEEKTRIGGMAMDTACGEEALEDEENKTRALQEKVLESLARRFNTKAPVTVAFQEGSPSQKPKLFITRIGSRTTFILEFKDKESEDWNEDFSYNLVLHPKTDSGELRTILGNNEDELVKQLAQALTPRY